MNEHLPICPIAKGRHLYPYMCCCRIIQYTQKNIADHLLRVCKHSATVPCWKCVEMAVMIEEYKFEDYDEA